MKNIRPGKLPTIRTLKTYGLSESDYVEIFQRQDGLCPICLKPPKIKDGVEVPLVIDHFHIKSFEKMPPEKRKTWVRGLLHSYCNLRCLPKSITIDNAQNIADYLKAFEKRRR